MIFYKSICSLFFIALIIASPISYAKDTLTFTAPPRESAKKGIKTYEPIAKFLSKVTGKKVVYVQPRSWFEYTVNMRNKKYDFLFDGPHFASWRTRYQNHRPVVKIPGDFIFAFVAKKENSKVNRLNDIVGRTVCGQAPPNQGTLRLYDQLNNPMRQPVLVTTKGWKKIYKRMIKGDCDVAIVPMNIYRRLDPKRVETKALFLTRPTAGQAITMSPDFTYSEFKKIQDALLSEDGQAATKNLQKRFASKDLVEAKAEDYIDTYKLLKYSYGFTVN